MQRLTLAPSAKNLARFAQVRRQELEGLCNGAECVVLPERAYAALGRLGVLRAMMAGIKNFVARDIQAESRDQLKTTFRHVRELTKILGNKLLASLLGRRDL